MDLIARYIQEVERRLPRDQRGDVAKELRSSLEDSLESRAGISVDLVDEKRVTELLLEFGPPQEVADSFRTGPAYLIGPAHYPSFLRAMKVGLAVVGGLIGVGTLIDIIGSSGSTGDLGRIGARAITNVQLGFLGLLGLVVLIFAIIERRTTPFDRAQADWDPSDLPPIRADADVVDRTGAVVGLVLGAVALALIVFAPEWLRIHMWSDGDLFTVPLLGSALRAEMPILVLYLVLSLTLGIIVVKRGAWRPQTRLADAAISTVLVLFLARLWNKADMLLPGETDLLSAGWPSPQAADFTDVAAEVLSPLLWWILLAGVLLAAWASVRKIIAFLRTVRSS